MARKLSIFIFVTVILASVLFAHAQQPTKVPRIGYLAAGAAISASTRASRHSVRVCASLGTWRGKTLSLNIAMQRAKLDRLPRFAVRAGASQGRRHRHRWSDSNPGCQGSDEHDSHCHGTG